MTRLLPNLAECDYYQGVGSCSFGCHEEPSCMTDRPMEGWPDLDWHPVKVSNMRGRRLGHRAANWLAWRRSNEWLANLRGSTPEATP